MLCLVSTFSTPLTSLSSAWLPESFPTTLLFIRVWSGQGYLNNRGTFCSHSYDIHSCSATLHGAEVFLLESFEVDSLDFSLLFAPERNSVKFSLLCIQKKCFVFSLLLCNKVCNLMKRKEKTLFKVLFSGF